MAGRRGRFLLASFFDNFQKFAESCIVQLEKELQTERDEKEASIFNNEGLFNRLQQE